MKKLHCLLGVILAFLCICTLSACSGVQPESAQSENAQSNSITREEQLLGTWTSIDEVEKITFYSDGTCASGSDGEYHNYDYSINENTIKLSDSYGNAQVFDYTLDGFKLALSAGDETLYLYKETGETYYVTKTREELQQELEASAVFNEKIAEYRGQYQELSYSMTFVGDRLERVDETFYATELCYYYELTCRNVYPYLTEDKTICLYFDYVPKADDFYFSGSEIISQNEEWDIAGTWCYEYYDFGVLKNIYVLDIEAVNDGYVTASYTTLDSNGNALKTIESTDYSMISTYPNNADHGEQSIYIQRINQLFVFSKEDGVVINSYGFHAMTRRD